MKKAVGLSIFLVAFSITARAQEIDYDARNRYIFCASHLAVVSEALNEKGDERQALMYLSGMHRDSARRMGATKQHFADVTGYLKKVRSNNEQKWNKLSAQSKRVCLPSSEDGTRARKTD